MRDHDRQSLSSLVDFLFLNFTFAKKRRNRASSASSRSKIGKKKKKKYTEN